ncbi:MAG: hypothetical protein WCH39_11610 [Schlesneria sp.]
MPKLFIVAFIVVVLANMCGVIADDKESPPFKITTKRDNDKVEVKIEKDQAIFLVHSPNGISQAVIERVNEKWPEVIVLKLYLTGLESFRVSNGKVTVDASVSSHNDKQRVRLWRDGKEDAPLDIKSPYWMEIGMVGDDGKPLKTIPLKNGHFQIQLPKACFEDNPKSITINWIDFYR